jgi:acyl-CoA synthetase (AMP-forming)/AMP-acid ligase II
MSITQLIHRGKNMYAERTAFVYRERKTSFLELHDRVARTASVLRKLDPSDGACLGILSAASDLAITSFFGASWAGIVPNYLNIRWSEYELSGSIDDFQPRILVVDDMFLEMGLSLQQRCDCVEHVSFRSQQSPTRGCTPRRRYWRIAPVTSTTSPTSTTQGALLARARG